LDNLGIKIDKALRVSNRLVIDYEYLRPSLLVGLVKTSGLNISHSNSFALFEVGKIFEKPSDLSKLPKQPKKISGIFIQSSFTDSKGIIETFFNRLNIANITYRLKTAGEVFSKSSAQIISGNKVLGVFGELDEKVLANFEIFVPTFGFELDFETLQNLNTNAVHKSLPKYPIVKEDISMLVPNNIVFTDIAKQIKRGAGENFFNLELVEDIDIDGKRSVLVSVEYFDNKKTLDRSQIDNIRERVIAKLEQHKVKIRT
jgi:phenylalanyl-tRNA synthetase beta chain